MSDLSVMVHAFEDLLAGKLDFKGMLAKDEGIIQARIETALPAVQPILHLAYEAFKAGASSLVGAGETALGPIINTSSDTLATVVLNAMQAAGVPAGGVLTVAEHAALVTIINGLKAGLDKAHIMYATHDGQGQLPLVGGTN